MKEEEKGNADVFSQLKCTDIKTQVYFHLHSVFIVNHWSLKFKDSKSCIYYVLHHSRLSGVEKFSLQAHWKDSSTKIYKSSLWWWSRYVSISAFAEQTGKSWLGFGIWLKGGNSGIENFYLSKLKLNTKIEYTKDIGGQIGLFRACETVWNFLWVK